jgi:hypothetical protein
MSHTDKNVFSGQVTRTEDYPYHYAGQHQPVRRRPVHGHRGHRRRRHPRVPHPPLIGAGQS